MLLSYFTATFIEIILKKVLCLMLSLEEKKKIGMFLS